MYNGLATIGGYKLSLYLFSAIVIRKRFLLKHLATAIWTKTIWLFIIIQNKHENLFKNIIS